MFLDIAHSTGVAEAMGELRVHDRITRFFFDIDEPISSHGGAVHAYVGDEVIVCWPVTADPARNGRCVLCFFAIERSMARLAADYRREFELLRFSRLGCTPGPLLSANAATSNASSPFRRHHARRSAAMRALQGGRSAVGGLGICA
jgi:adenylate cyclase